MSNQQEKFEKQQQKYSYEKVRRRYKGELEQYQWKTAIFVTKTYKLLKMLGMKDEEIRRYYAR